MSFWAAGSAINFLTSFVITLIVLFRSIDKKLSRTFCGFSFFVSAWSLGYTFWQLSSNGEIALFWCRFFTVFSLLIPPSFFHFVMAFVHRDRSDRSAIIVSYLYSIIFAFLSFTSLMVVRVAPKFCFSFWPEAGSLYVFHILQYVFLCSYAFFVLYQEFQLKRGNEREKIKYVFLGMFLGFLGGATNFPLWYNIPIYPIGNILVSLYVILVTVAIVRYQLLDIRFVITQFAIFVVVYSLAIGIPFFLELAYPQYRWLSLITLALLATAGPFIFLFLEKRAHKAFFKEQRRYQGALKDASLEMVREKDLSKLTKLIVDRVINIVHLKYAALYVSNNMSDEFQMAGCLSRNESVYFEKSFSGTSLIVKSLFLKNDPFSINECRRTGIAPDEDGLNNLEGGLVVPTMIGIHLTGFLVLGPKESGADFSTEDIEVFTIFANQVALAIENAQYYVESVRIQEKLFKAEKMTMLAHLAGGLSHQLGNKLTAIKVYLQQGMAMPDRDEAAGLLQKAKTNVDDTNAFIKNLLNFATNREFKEAVDLEKLVDATLGFKDLKNYKIEVQFEKRFAPDTPKAHANFVQLQEALLNIIDNAVYSMQEKSNAGVDPAYQPRIIFTGAQKGDRVALTIEDNGMGIKPEDQRKLFKPHFSTKKETGAGHGFGVYFVREVVENRNGGTVQYSSEYGQGVKIEVELPGYNE